MAERQGFTIYHSDLNALSRFLTAEQIGKLVLAITLYSETGEIPESIDPSIAGALALIVPKIDEQKANYDETVRRNQQKYERKKSTRAKTDYSDLPQFTPDYPSLPQFTPCYPETTGVTQGNGGEFDQQELELKQELKQELELKQEQESTAATPPTRARGADAPTAPPKPKKKSEAEKIDEAVATYAESYGDDDTRTLLTDWLKVRKAKRAPNTLRAIQLNLDKLDRTALESGLNINDYLREIIRLGWAAFYEIKDKGGGFKAPPRSQPQSTADFYLDMLREERAKENDDG